MRPSRPIRSMIRGGGIALESFYDACVRGGDDGEIRALQAPGDAESDKKRCRCGSRRLDELAVRADQLRRLHDGVVDPDLVALADEPLRKLDVRALAKVVARSP